MSVRFTSAIFRYRRFSLVTKIILSAAVVFGAMLGRVPGGLKYRIHWELWNIADIGIHADYWFAILRLSMPWAYKTSGTTADVVVVVRDFQQLQTGVTNG